VTSYIALRRLLPGFVLLLPVLLAFCTPAERPRLASRAAPADLEAGPGWGLVIHGGAGTITRGSLSAAVEAEIRGEMERALRAGHAVLERGGTSLDAVAAAIVVLEDSPHFNAGRGAVFTADGRNELDAAIMDGRTRNAGAIAGVTTVKNPIHLARLVMDASPHVFMAREGAEAFGREHGIEFVDPAYFRTESRWRALERAREAEQRQSALPEDARFGTVGAVAVDRQGNIAAGTSTGGMTNKRFGRIGDVPVIGAGTYADNRSCGVSATGHGEYFIRAVVAHDICNRMLLQGISLEEAARRVVMEDLVEFGGSGGVIAMDRHGNVAMPFNTSGMYRGRIDAGGRLETAIYAD
jgi:L-asparaginase / beta-aspartyl-peptidase